MRRLPVLIALLMIVGCGPKSDEGGSKTAAAGSQTASEQPAAEVQPDAVAAPAIEQTFGPGVSAGEVTSISDIFSNPDVYVNKTVRVEGTAVAVCEHRGCWFNIASDLEGQVLRFKVQDGVIVFPMEMVGETMRAEGVFTANELDLETTRKLCEREAAATGEIFDPESVTECRTVYQLSGIGAVQLANPQ